MGRGEGRDAHRGALARSTAADDLRSEWRANRLYSSDSPHRSGTYRFVFAVVHAPYPDELYRLGAFDTVEDAEAAIEEAKSRLADEGVSYQSNLRDESGWRVESDTQFEPGALPRVLNTYEAIWIAPDDRRRAFAGVGEDLGEGLRIRARRDFEHTLSDQELSPATLTRISPQEVSVSGTDRDAVISLARSEGARRMPLVEEREIEEIERQAQAEREAAKRHAEQQVRELHRQESQARRAAQRVARLAEKGLPPDHQGPTEDAPRPGEALAEEAARRREAFESAHPELAR